MVATPVTDLGQAFAIASGVDPLVLYRSLAAIAHAGVALFFAWNVLRLNRLRATNKVTAWTVKVQVLMGAASVAVVGGFLWIG